MPVFFFFFFFIQNTTKTNGESPPDGGEQRLPQKSGSYPVDNDRFGGAVTLDDEQEIEIMVPSRGKSNPFSFGPVDQGPIQTILLTFVN